MRRLIGTMGRVDLLNGGRPVFFNDPKRGRRLQQYGPIIILPARSRTEHAAWPNTPRACPNCCSLLPHHGHCHPHEHKTHEDRDVHHG